VEIQGRSRTLRLNYRTTEQIRRSSDLLLPVTLTESDGNEERRDGVVSLFDGRTPEIQTFEGEEAEEAALSQWTQSLFADGITSDEIAFLGRSADMVERCRRSKRMLGDVATGIECMEMHDAKGLEFRAIAIVGCDDGVVPDEIIATERHLLYVAFSRARERVWLSSSGAPSEFISDLLE
jgi:superfamily I DNA/RNA helicase